MVLSEYFLWLKKEWVKVGLILSIYLFVMLIVFVRKYDFVVFFQEGLGNSSTQRFSTY